MRAILLGGLLVLLAAGAAGAQPIGYIDGGYWGNGQYNVSGWACDPRSSRPVQVALVDPASGGVMVYGTANAPSEPAVAGACSAPGATNLRFSIPLAGWPAHSFVPRSPCRLGYVAHRWR